MSVIGSIRSALSDESPRKQCSSAGFYARVVASPQATAEPVNLSILVPATRTRRLIRRGWMTTLEVCAYPKA
jgi:hypothetical protein